MPNFIPALKHSIKRDITKVIGAFDIETVPEEMYKINPHPGKRTPTIKISDHALFGSYADGFLKYEDDDTYYRASSMQEMFKLIMSRGNVVLYAHNGKGYEFNYLVEEFYKYDSELKIKIILQGDTQVIGLLIEHEGGTIELRDSYALVPMSLKDATVAFKTTSKGNIGLGNGELYDKNNTEHQEYCKLDCQCTIEVVRKVIAMTAEVFGCGIGMTTASTAMACFKAMIPEKTEYRRMSYSLEEFVRSGYYGGYVYPGTSIQKYEDITSIDRNASFAGSMREGVPVGKPRYVVEYEEGRIGMYKCRIIAEKGKITIPCVPYRTKAGLKWPYGRFTTIITSHEIDFAREQGYRVIIDHGLVWDRVEYPFNEIVDLCERIEREQPHLKPFIKLIRNSLYGKFGSKLWNKEVMFGMPEDLEGWTPLCDERLGHLLQSVWYRTTSNDANYIQPMWAACITALARIWMFKTMLTVGMEHVVYGDTDSVKASTDALDDAIKAGKIDMRKGVYGSAKIDEEYVWFQCLGPKFYHGVLKAHQCKKEVRDSCDGSCRDKMRAKGIRKRDLTHELYDDAYLGHFDQIEYISSNSTMTRLANPMLDIKKIVKRSVTNFRKSQTWIVEEDNISPPTIEEKWEE